MLVRLDGFVQLQWWCWTFQSKRLTNQLACWVKRQMICPKSRLSQQPTWICQRKRCGCSQDHEHNSSKQNIACCRFWTHVHKPMGKLHTWTQTVSGQCVRGTSASHSRNLLAPLRQLWTYGHTWCRYVSPLLKYHCTVEWCVLHRGVADCLVHVWTSYGLCTYLPGADFK